MQDLREKLELEVAINSVDMDWATNRAMEMAVIQYSREINGLYSRSNLFSKIEWLRIDFVSLQCQATAAGNVYVYKFGAYTNLYVES